MKFPLRIFGEIHGLDSEKIDSLHSLPENVFQIRKDRLEIEYEGYWLDIEHDLDAIVSALAENGHGHVDCLDHDNWEVLRYQLKPGAWTCKRVSANNILEPLLRE